jgi:hypothetical protein
MDSITCSVRILREQAVHDQIREGTASPAEMFLQDEQGRGLDSFCAIGIGNRDSTLEGTIAIMNVPVMLFDVDWPVAVRQIHGDRMAGPDQMIGSDHDLFSPVSGACPQDGLVA